MVRTAITVVGTAALAMTVTREPPPTVIGMLEQPPQCPKARNEQVRALFARRGDAWIPLNGQDSLRGIDLRATTFRLALDGRSLGLLNTTDAGFQGDDWFFRRDHGLDVVSGQTLPRIANKLHRFHGWCEAPAVRPIVTIVNGHYEDPEHWKPFVPAADVKDKLLATFRVLEPKMSVCKRSPGPDSLRGEREVPYHYTARDLVVEAAYQNASGRQIVALGFRSSLRPCDWGPGDFDNHWFLLGPTPKHIGDAMDLIDAGDYDGDGHSEVLFWTWGEDVDGYVIMYNDLQKHTEFLWSYH